MKARARAGVVTTKVTVKMTEYHFALSRNSVPRGIVNFTVVNAGTIVHDFQIAGKKTPFMQPGRRVVLRVVFKTKGKYQYLCSVGEHAIHGMFGHLKVT